MIEDTDVNIEICRSLITELVAREAKKLAEERNREDNFNEFYIKILENNLVELNKLYHKLMSGSYNNQVLDELMLGLVKAIEDK